MLRDTEISVCLLDKSVARVRLRLVMQFGKDFCFFVSLEDGKLLSVVSDLRFVHLYRFFNQNRFLFKLSGRFRSQSNARQ